MLSQRPAKRAYSRDLQLRCFTSSAQIVEPWAVLICITKKICPVPFGDKSDFLVAETGFEPVTFGL